MYIYVYLPEGYDSLFFFLYFREQLDAYLLLATHPILFEKIAGQFLLILPLIHIFYFRIHPAKRIIGTITRIFCFHPLYKKI